MKIYINIKSLLMISIELYKCIKYLGLIVSAGGQEFMHAKKNQILPMKKTYSRHLETQNQNYILVAIKICLKISSTNTSK